MIERFGGPDTGSSMNILRRPRGVIVALLLAILALAVTWLFRLEAGGLMKTRNGNAVDSGRIGVAQASEGEGRRARAGTVQANPSTDRREAGTPRFRGSIAGMPTAHVLNGGVVQLVPESQLVLQEDENEWRPRHQQFEFTAGSGRISDVLPTHEYRLEPGGWWEMPIPDEDWVVTSVHSNDGRARVLAGGRIPAEARSASLKVEMLGLTSIEVLDARSGAGLGGLKVMESRARGLRSGGKVSIDLKMEFGGQMSGPERKGPAAPPPDSQPLLDRGVSPIRIPTAEYPRDIWVGKKGYQWKRVHLEGGGDGTSIYLGRHGELAIRLINVAEGGGAYDLFVFRDGGLATSWRSIKRDRSLALVGAAEGRYVVILRETPHSGAALLYSGAHSIIAAETNTITLDVGRMVSELPGPGSLAVRVRGLSDEASWFDDFRLLVFPLREGVAELPIIDRRLGRMDRDGGGLREQFPVMPSGEYLVGLSPCGIRARVQVRPGADTEVPLDCRPLSIAKIWPTDERGEARDTLPPEWNLQWRGAGPTDPRSDGSAGGVSGGRGVADLLLRGVTRQEGHWRLVVPSGGVRLFVTDSNGHGVSDESVLHLPRGHSEHSLDVLRSDVNELRILIKDMEPSAKSEVLEQLRGSFAHVLGGGEVVRVEWCRAQEHRRNGDEEVIVQFSEAGEYLTSPLESGGRSSLIGLPPRVRIESGRSGSIELRWRQ